MLHTIPIHRSLYKPLLFVGCERLPFTLIVVIGGAVIMAYMSLFVTLSVLVFYLVSIILIRRVNESDPQYFRCLYRYLRYYQDYYPSSEFYPGVPDCPFYHFE
jgi:type IV secretory pathway TrbD component